jgi:hypothetical protein
MSENKKATTDIDFRTTEVKNKWRSKEEKELCEEIYERFQEMVTARQSVCYWAQPGMIDTVHPQLEDGKVVWDIQGGDTGTDLNDELDKCYKLWSQWHSYPSDGTPNVKSPISWAPVEAALAEFQDNNVGVTLSPVNEEDKEKVKIMQQALRFLETHGDFGKSKAVTLHEALITGTSFAYVCWLSREREVELLMNSREIEAEVEENMDDKKKSKELKTKLSSKKPLTKTKTIHEYNDIAYIPVSVYEIWVDPDARDLHGNSHEAVDLVWRNIMSLDQFKGEYMQSSDPYLIKENFDKVVSAKDAGHKIGDIEHPFFDVPPDINSDNQVEVVRYFNKYTDKYIILANDVLVRDGPLPYNHKQIPFVVHRAIKFPHRFYGIGLPTVLESLQSEDEALRNMMLSQLHLNIFPPIIVNENVFNDYEESMDYPGPGKIIGVNGETGPQNLRWFEGSQPRMEYAMMRNTIQEDAVKTSGINPLAYSTPQPNQPVRNNMLSLESTLKMLKRMFKNWAEGQKEAVKQELSIMQQMYTKDKIIKLEGMTMEEKKGKLQETQIDGFSYFELKPKYFDLKGDPDIEIDIDTLLPMSQGLKMQKIEQAMTQLMPVFANPALLKAPGVAQLIREYVETHQLSPKLLEMIKDESSGKELEQAEEQEKLMEQGFEVSGIAGESDGHKLHHLHTYLEWKQKLDDLQNKLWEKPQTLQPNAMGMVQVGPPQDTPEIMKLRKSVEKLAKHMVDDNELKDVGVQAPPRPNQQALGQLPPQSFMGMGGMAGGMPVENAPMGAGMPMGGMGGMSPEAQGVPSRMGQGELMGQQGGVTGPPPMSPPM